MKVADLKTPCALVELDVVERNARRMADRMSSLGMKLRPHVKTHKCAEAARIQTRGHFGGITVSTLAEARFFAAAGFGDITYAVPFPMPRVDEAAGIARSVDRLSLLLDQMETLKQLEAYAREKDVRFPVFLKVDAGGGRAGVDPKSEEGEALAVRLARSQRLDFRGILTHAGQSYSCRSSDEILGIAREERGVMVAFADRLKRAGVEAPEISIGSTPTMSVADNLEGATEARPGNYIFYDVFQATIGSCTLDDAAFSVLATVVGHYPRGNKIIIDAGGTALSKDAGPRHVDPDCGYGVVCDAEGTRFPGLKLFSLSQEHGQIGSTRRLDFPGFPVGSRVRILPNHSCMAAAMFDRYHVVRRGEVIGEWKSIRDW
ncbi:MAG: alanine racemase [Planctomycetota bacterium]|jgi:D-serine deaminase-like pyridoxal phosphate-dependent protein